MLFRRRKVAATKGAKAKKPAWREWLEAGVFALFTATLIRTFSCEAYTIPSGSMEGTLLINDYLFVNKMAYGPRIPNTPLALPLIHNTIPLTGGKSYTDAVELKYHRLPGFGHVERNDIVVFNGPSGDTAIIEKPEKQKINASITESENNRKNAQAYFNFLLNKPLTEVVVIDTEAVAQLPNVVEDNALDVTQREELLQLKDATSIYALNTQLKRAYLVPKVNTSLDLGSQGFNWQYDNKTQYYFWGVNLQWDLFAAGRNNYKIKQASIDQAGSSIAYDDAEKSFMLQLTQALNNYNSALANYKSAEEQLQLATKYYNDQLKVYKEGQLLYIELIDALNQLTTAKLQESITLANVHIAVAAIERNKASYPINNK